MATFMNATPSISPVKGMAMTLIDIIREEGRRLAESHCGYKYLMTHYGTYKDFKEGRMTIRRKDREGVPSTYNELRARGHTDQQIRKMFVRFFTRDYVTSNGVADPSPPLVEAEWQSFKNSPHTRKIKSPTRRGGKVTYANLVEEGESEEQIEMTFNARGHKCGAMKPGSYRCKMYEELQKMLANFNVSDYHAGKRAPPLSDDFEKHSLHARGSGHRPTTPTTFCQAVARMMTLVRLAHQESGADERNWKKAAEKVAKKIANNKRCEKYNRIQSQMGVDNFNRMKARDQEAKEKKAAEKVSQAGMTGRTAQFVKWRTEKAEGKKFDVPPTKAYVTPVTALNSLAPPPIKHLGYTSHKTLAQIVERCLDNPHKYTDIYIKFTPDPGDATSQVYQYAPIYGQRPAQLRKTRDADTARTFRVCGMLIYRNPGPSWTSSTEYYIQPAIAPHGAPMRGHVYYSLPTEWKDYEQWTGFGVMGNPQKSTDMETLFKIVDNNITEITFITGGGRYRAAYSNYNPKSADQILEGIVKVPTPAEAAAAAAEVEKKRRAKESREKEKRERQRRFRREQMNRMLGGEKHREVFGQFFGVGTKQEDATTKAKVNLAIKLAQGDINQATFNAAMDALN